MGTPLEDAYQEGRDAARMGASEESMRCVWMFEAAEAWKRGYADFHKDLAEEIAMGGI